MYYSNEYILNIQIVLHTVKDTKNNPVTFLKLIAQRYHVIKGDRDILVGVGKELVNIFKECEKRIRKFYSLEWQAKLLKIFHEQSYIANSVKECNVGLRDGVFTINVLIKDVDTVEKLEHMDKNTTEVMVPALELCIERF